MSFRSWFSSLTSRRFVARGQRPSRRPTSRLCIEALEDRIVPAAALSVGDPAIFEGDQGTRYAMVSVSMSIPGAKQTVTVDYATADRTATAGSDYGAVSGRLTFAPGEVNKTITVPVYGDFLAEPNESFFINLSGAKRATIADGQGVVTIWDDEPRVYISDSYAVEGTTGTTPLTFSVYLSHAYDLPVTVEYATADGTATAGDDYQAASGTVTFAPGQTSQTITVLVNGDRLAEPNETFFLNVSSADSYVAIGGGAGGGTIIDSVPRIRSDDGYNWDGMLIFYVSLSVATEEAVTVNYATADGTAVAGVDYVAVSGTLTFAPGEMYQEIFVEVLNGSADTFFSMYFSATSPNAILESEIVYGYCLDLWYYDPYEEPYQNYYL
jgi:hypothetical protein